MSAIPAEGIHGRSDDAAFARRISAILGLIEEARRLPASALKGEVEGIESRLVALRDELIVRQRMVEPPPAAQLPALMTINTALSLVVSIEYPSAGIHREALDETYKLLKKFFSA